MHFKLIVSGTEGKLWSFHENLKGTKSVSYILVVDGQTKGI